MTFSGPLLPAVSQVLDETGHGRQRLALTDGGEEEPDLADDGAGLLASGAAAAADIGALTWQQRERVLRALFEQVTRGRQRAPPPPPPQHFLLAARQDEPELQLPQPSLAPGQGWRRAVAELSSDDDDKDDAPLRGVRNFAGPAGLL